MSHQWFELQLTIAPEDVDLITGVLYQLGCGGITVEDQALDTFTPPDPHAPDTGGRIQAYFEGGSAEDWRSKVLSALAEYPDLSPVTDLRVVPVHQEDWAEGWKQNFPPIYVGDELLILPTWEPLPPNPPPCLLRLDPGMAFGTGTHATTALCLKAIVAASRQKPLQQVLDVGTGSGILAMAAAKLGSPTVIGCEIEEEACRVARENCQLNGLSDTVHITNDPLESLPGPYDLVVANILAEENVRLATQLVERVAPDGWLILSGILDEKRAWVIEGFSSFALEGPDVQMCDEWVCLSYRRRT